MSESTTEANTQYARPNSLAPRWIVTKTEPKLEAAKTYQARHQAHGGQRADDEHVERQAGGPHVDEPFTLVARGSRLVRCAERQHDVEHDFEHHEGGQEPHGGGDGLAAGPVAGELAIRVPEEGDEDGEDGQERDPGALLAKGHLRRFHMSNIFDMLARACVKNVGHNILDGGTSLGYTP